MFGYEARLGQARPWPSVVVMAVIGDVSQLFNQVFDRVEVISCIRECVYLYNVYESVD